MGIHLIPVHSFQILQLLPERLQALIIHALHLRQAVQGLPHPGQNGRQIRKLPHGLRRGQRQKSPASHKNRASRQPGQAPGGTYPQHGIPLYRAFPCLHGMAPFLTGAQRRMQPKLFIQKGRRITPAEKTAPEPQPPPHRQKETCGGKGASRQPAPVSPHPASAVPDHPSYRTGGKKRHAKTLHRQHGIQQPLHAGNSPPPLLSHD